MFKIYFVFLLLCKLGYAARVLGIYPLMSQSHQIVYDPVMVEFVSQGHEVVTITPFPLSHSPENLTQIDVSHTIPLWKKKMSYASFGDKSPMDFHIAFKIEFLDIFMEQIKTPGIAKLIHDTKIQFDLLFISVYIEQGFAFAHRFKGIPYIGIASIPTDYHTTGAPDHPILYADVIRSHFEFDRSLTLKQKLENVYEYLYFYYFERILWNGYNQSLRKIFGYDMPCIGELHSKMDLLFLSAHPLISGIRPLVQSIININGLHLKAKKPLPEDLQSFLDHSTNGVVYMSLGSNVRSKDLGISTLQIIKEAFSELPYNFLWKFEADDLPGRPQNVFIKKWLPQQDLLSHKNIKAFIFQGGQQSFEEAIRDKVPLLCIPIALDQWLKGKTIEKYGVGIKMDIRTLRKETFKENIIRLISEPRYKENMAKLSELMTDQPSNSMERAVWWTEYVLRHKGAPHLRSPTADVSFFGYFMLDDAAVVIIALVVILLTLALIVKLIFRLLVIKKKVKTN